MRSGSQRYAGTSSNSNTILSSIIPSASSKLPTMIKSSFGTNRRVWQLLQNIRAQLVFDAKNVRLLRQVSWCCVGAGAVCLVSCLYYLPFIAVAIAAGFMALIVRIVKNVFEQAIRMKDELDYTI